ncbi:MAG: hypothetical protein HZY78_02560 [Burkholderiaceae bacterium]|nr:MAG: hypothetical protein HZY78_02560 [Burkholderiaceae bacterium]
MNLTLVTFLGKGRDSVATGYRQATYQFADGRRRSEIERALETLLGA